MASRVFFRGLRVRLMSTLPVILLLIGVSKQKLLFSPMIWYAECFFHGWCNSFKIRVNFQHLNFMER